MASPLAFAAAGRPGASPNDPFGLSGNPAHGIGATMSNPAGFQLMNPPAQPQTKTPTQTPVVPLPITPATTPGATGAATPSAGQFSFNLQTDPALQQVNAMVGLSDQQAQAQALKERQQQLLQYGDPTLAAAVLGANDPTVMAAGQNQESDLAQLGRQNAQNVKGFETQLDPSLTFSGYKIGQEQQLGQNYQDALAKAASGVQGSLDSITGNLNSTLNQNQMQSENALQTAFQTMLQEILAGGAPVAGYVPPSYVGPGGQTVTPTTYGALGVQPQQITADMVAPPTPLAPVSLQQAANQVRRTPIPGGSFYTA